jgi:serine/threonine-protein kinase RsbT
MAETLMMEYEIRREDYINGGKASSSIKKICHELGIPTPLIRKIAITTFEAEMNLVIHSDGGKIILEVHENRIRLVSQDCGPGINDIDMAMKPGYSTANQKAREMGFGAGMGLPNMKKNADVFHIQSSSSGTIIEMIYHL